MRNLRIDRARNRLLDLRKGRGVWGYRARTTEAVEPSTLASLALLATDPDSKGESLAVARATATWLASAAIRNSDGSLGVTPALLKPGWTTPYGLLLWASVGGFAAERSAADRWLLGLKGKTLVKAADDPMGHDSTIVGWPWVADTHSWVEPTALVLLGLAMDGQSAHPRVREGVRLLVDRAIPGGGWNLGNPVVFKTPLRPLPGPTGLALLALARLDGPNEVVRPAIGYLRTSLAETLAPISLSWGLLGLRAWGSEPSESATWLDSAFEQIESVEQPSPVDLALLLLASSGDRALGLLGLRTPRKEADHG